MLLLPNQCVLTNLHDRLGLVFSTFLLRTEKGMLGVSEAGRKVSMLPRLASVGGLTLVSLYCTLQGKAGQPVSGRQGEPDTEDRTGTGTGTGMEQLSAKKEAQILKMKKKKPPHVFYNKELKAKGKTMLQCWV